MIETAHLRGRPLKWNYLHPEVVEILNLAAVWSMRSGVTVILTSVNDHGHKEGSLHYRDWAVDFDTRGNVTSDLQRLSSFLRRNVHPGVDVVFEGNHVHVEVEYGKFRPGEVPSE